MSVWSFVLYGLLPIGVFLLGVLTIPLPAFLSNTSQCRSIRGVTLKLLHRLLFTNLKGTLPVALIHLVLLVLLVITAFLANEVVGEYRHHSHSEHGNHHHAHADVLLMQQGKLWRNQRNCYLALSALITYWALYCVLLYQERIHRMEEMLQNAPNAKPPTQQQPASSASGSAVGGSGGSGSLSRGMLAKSSRSSPSDEGRREGEGEAEREVTFASGSASGGSGKSQYSTDPAADSESEQMTDNALRRRVGTTPQPSAPHASLLNSNAAK